MNEKPKINPPLTALDIIVEALGALCLIYMIVQLIIEYPNMSNEVATHYDASGTPDAWGHKSSMLILPMITIVLFAGMTVLNRFPHIFNYPVAITQENAFKQYQLAKSLISYLKAFVVALFLYIQIYTINVSQGLVSGLGPFFVIAVMAGTIVPIILYLIFASRQK